MVARVLPAAVPARVARSGRAALTLSAPALAARRLEAMAVADADPDADADADADAALDALEAAGPDTPVLSVAPVDADGARPGA